MLGERDKGDRKPTGRKRERGKVAERRKKKEEPEGRKSAESGERLAKRKKKKWRETSGLPGVRIGSPAWQADPVRLAQGQVC